jgi:squalene-hopene/tetraprenyl-beta-curcumene cyclase
VNFVVPIRHEPVLDPDLRGVEARISAATDALLAIQHDDGHWCFELEADATIPAEYILLTHYLGETPDLERESKIARYLRRIQGVDGGWSLFHGGSLDISATVKAYFALKMIGDDLDAPHMVRAREAILERGGASEVNIFTRIQLALYGIVPWSAVPTMPVEMILLPTWFPVHLSKMSYWARVVLVPLLVLMALKPQARNPRVSASRNCSSATRRRISRILRPMPIRAGPSSSRASTASSSGSIISGPSPGASGRSSRRSPSRRSA